MCICVHEYTHTFSFKLKLCSVSPTSITGLAYPVTRRTLPGHCVPSGKFNCWHLSQEKPAEVGSNRSVNFSFASKSLWVFWLLHCHLFYPIRIIFLSLGHLFPCSRTCHGVSFNGSTCSFLLIPHRPSSQPAPGHTPLAASPREATGVLPRQSPQAHGPPGPSAPPSPCSTSPLPPPLVFAPQHPSSTPCARLSSTPLVPHCPVFSQ